MGMSALKSAPGRGFTGGLFSVTNVTEQMNGAQTMSWEFSAAGEAGEGRGIPWNYGSFGTCPAQCLSAPSLAISWQGTQLIHLKPPLVSPLWPCHIWVAPTPQPSKIPSSCTLLPFLQVKSCWGKTWRVLVSPQHQQLHPRSFSTSPHSFPLSIPWRSRSRTASLSLTPCTAPNLHQHSPLHRTSAEGQPHRSHSCNSL